MTLAQDKRRLIRAMDNAIARYGFSRTKGSTSWRLKTDSAAIIIEIEKSRGFEYHFLNAAIELSFSESAWMRGRLIVPPNISLALDLRTPLGFSTREVQFSEYLSRNLIPHLLTLSTLQDMIVNWYQCDFSGRKLYGRYLSDAGLGGGWERNVPSDGWAPSLFRSRIFTKQEMDALRYDSEPAYAAKLDFEQQEIVLITRFVYALHKLIVLSDSSLSSYKHWLIGYVDAVRQVVDFRDQILTLQTHPEEVCQERLLGLAVWDSVCSAIDRGHA